MNNSLNGHSFQQSSKLWVTFLAETSKDLEIILIIIVLSLTNRLSRTSLYLSLKTTNNQRFETCLKAKIKASA